MKNLKQTKILALAVAVSGFLLISIYGGVPLDKALGQGPVLRSMSYNVDTNISRLEGVHGRAHNTHKQWRIEHRVENLKRAFGEVISGYSPDIIAVQEGRAFELDGVVVDSLTPIVEHLEGFGYGVELVKYNPSALACTHIMAYKRGRFDVLEVYPYYLTKTPSEATDRDQPEEAIRENNFGDYWERCVAVVHLWDREQGCDVFSIGVHPSSKSWEQRKRVCSMVSDWVGHLKGEFPGACFVMQGDFNSFDTRGGPEQLQIMRERGVMTQASEVLLLADGVEVQSSFVAFPYDFAANERRLKEEARALFDLPVDLRRSAINSLFEEECLALGGHLDRVYFTGYARGQSYLLPAWQFAGDIPGDYTEASVKSYIMRHIGEGPAFASDHQPILTLFWESEGTPKEEL